MNETENVACIPFKVSNIREDLGCEIPNCDRDAFPFTLKGATWYVTACGCKHAFWLAKDKDLI